MTEQAKAEQPGPAYDGDATCYPLRKWWQDPGLEPGMDGLQRRWPGCSPWLGSAPSPLFVPYVVGTPQQCSPNAGTEQYKWRVILDMTHFTPSEISVSVQEGFVVIGGSHPERADVYGFTARCFTRKYRLPVGIDVSKLTSAVYGDGILCVEAPLPETSVPADIVIPIQVEKETIGGQEMKEDHKEAAPQNGEPQHSEPTAPEQPAAEPEPSTEAPDHVEDSPLAGDDKQEEVQEAEVNGTPSGEPHPLAPADEEGTERFPEPSEHSEAMDSQENTEPASPMEQQIEAMDSQESTEPASPMEQQIEEPSKEATPETDTESRETQPTAPVLSDQPAAADHAEVSPPEGHGEEAAHPGGATGDLQEHEEGMEKDAEIHAEPTAEPHPLTPTSDEGAESLPEPPPEHREALDSQDSPGTAAFAEPAHDGEMKPEEATEEITQQHEEPEPVKGLPADGPSQELLDLEVSGVKQ